MEDEEQDAQQRPQQQPNVALPEMAPSLPWFDPPPSVLPQDFAWGQDSMERRVQATRRELVAGIHFGPGEPALLILFAGHDSQRQV
jgi:hypothetical protein